MLPKHLTKFFWDAPLETIDQTRNSEYVISRLLELGDDTAAKWLEQAYPANELKSVINGSRTLSPKSRNYWKLKYLHTHFAKGRCATGNTNSVADVYC